ncbi:MAG: sigma-70 family RNA polymerase sigma factor, partial [Firmicutes bacterium]|nr:sigma-70 family RNA polymerase sigma factor [Bacillota bacterium]
GAVKVGRSLKADAATVKKAENEFITTKGTSPRLSDLAEATGLSVERITEALNADDALRNYEDYETAALWTDNEDMNIAGMDLRASIRSLPEEKRKIILLRYYKDLTQQQVAGIMGISQVQVCRIERKALKELAEKV